MAAVLQKLQLFGEREGFSVNALKFHTGAHGALGLHRAISIGRKDLKVKIHQPFQDFQHALGDLLSSAEAINNDPRNASDCRKLRDIGHFLGSMGDTLAHIDDLFALDPRPNLLKKLTNAAFTFLEETHWFSDKGALDTWDNLLNLIDQAVEKIKPAADNLLSIVHNDLLDYENAICDSDKSSPNYLGGIGNYLASLGDSLVYIAGHFQETNSRANDATVKQLAESAKGFIEGINNIRSSCEGKSPLLNVLEKIRATIGDIFNNGVPDYLKW